MRLQGRPLSSADVPDCCSESSDGITQASLAHDKDVRFARASRARARCWRPIFSVTACAFRYV